MMTVEQFFSHFANMPLSERDQIMGKRGTKTWNQVYGELKRLEDNARPIRLRQAEILQYAAKVIYKWE